MPKKDRILNLPGFTLQKVSGKNPLILHVQYRRDARCAFCHSKQLRKKAVFYRQVRHHTLSRRRTYLSFKAFKFQCKQCGRYFNQRFPGILKYQRATETLKEEIFTQHSHGVDQKTLSTHFRLGKNTIERWYHQFYCEKSQHSVNQPCPLILGIDEHSFSRRHGYVTTFCDLKRHKVYELFQGKSESRLAPYLNQLIGKERVRLVCIDLSKSYRSIVKRHFPHAKIVADRFHVIRQLFHHTLKTYHLIDPELKYQRGLLAALRTHPDRLSRQREALRNRYFKQQPAIAALYHRLQDLYALLMKKCRTKQQCQRLIPRYLRWIERLKASPFNPLKTLGKTLEAWQEEIVCMWRFSKSNGITEGFHRKMKLIQRRAYGFRNFDNYRLRVRVLCS